MIKRTSLTIICALFVCLIPGCNARPLPYVPPSQAREQLKHLLKEDYKLNSTITQVGQTVWVYLPIKSSLYNLKGNKPGAVLKRESSTRQEIKLLEGTFENRTFKVDYDVELVKNYIKAQTYAYAPSEEFSKAQRFIFEVIKRCYPPKDQNTMKETFLKNEEYPDFFVIVFADITNGLEYSITFHLKDYHRASHDPGFSEEYQKRLVQKPLAGNSNIVGDEKGEHIEYKDIILPEFLLDQTLGRIRFKYGTSNFPPTVDTEKEFLKQFAHTLSAYAFEDFNTIILTNLKTNGISETTHQTLMTSFPLYKDKPKRKIHKITFDKFSNIEDQIIE